MIIKIYFCGGSCSFISQLHLNSIFIYSHDPHMFSYFSYTIMGFHMYSWSYVWIWFLCLNMILISEYNPHIWIWSSHLIYHSYACQYVWSHFDQHARECIITHDIYLFIYNSIVISSIFLNFQLCISWLYLIACL